jgi:ubiquitin-protein ligase
MSWTAAQRRRLQLEKDILESKFPGKVTWIDQQSPGKARVVVAMNTNNEKSYKLQINIPKDYPNSCPDMVVSYPNQPLTRRDGNNLYVNDHSYGVKDNRTTVCHFRANLWTNEYTMYQVFMKGRIWLEAYELHLATGKSMEKFLREMPG